MTEHHITPEEHSDIVGGSTAARRIGCPASYLLEQKVPKDETGSVYAQEGTALHELMAVILGQGKEPMDLLPFTYQKFSDETGLVDWEFTVDADLWQDKGAPALDAFDRYVENVEKEIGEPFEFLIEQRVEFPGITGAFGTSDIVGKCGEEVFIMDWKFGRGAVEVEENKQLSFYALGALNSCKGFLKDTNAETPVSLCIIQPVLHDRVQEYRTTVGKLDLFRIELIAAVEAARFTGAKMQKGPWCTFARCKSICPLYLNTVGDLSEKFAALQQKVEANAAARRAHEAPPHEIDFTTVYAELLDLAETVEDWASEVHKQAHSFAEGGGEIEGRKLVAKTGGARSWAKPDEDVMAFFKNRKFKLDEYMPRKLLTLPQGEKLLKTTGRELPEDMVKKPGISGYKLVRDGTKGEPYRPTAAQASELAAKLAKLGGDN